MAHLQQPIPLSCTLVARQDNSKALLGQQVLRVDFQSAELTELGAAMEQHVRTSLTRCNGLDLIGLCGKRRGQHGGLATLACRSTRLGWSRVQQQHRQRQPLTLTRKREGSRCDLRAGSPERLFVASSAAWKASLLAKPADFEVTSCTSSSTFWHSIAVAIRCVHRRQQFLSCLDLSEMST